MGLLLTLDDLGKIDLGPSSRYPPRKAVDGNPGTRWSSEFSDPQWMTIDLGAPAEITRLRLNWEEAYATEYKIEVSNDDLSWTTVRDVTNGDGGIDESDVSVSGRYVRMLGTGARRRTAIRCGNSRSTGRPARRRQSRPRHPRLARYPRRR